MEPPFCYNLTQKKSYAIIELWFGGGTLTDTSDIWKLYYILKGRSGLLRYMLKSASNKGKEVAIWLENKEKH